MPALNFQARFAEDVEDGRKRQSIRALRKDGKSPHSPGCTVYLYTGMRTKSCRKLGEAKCLSVTPIRIDGTEMFLDGQRVPAGRALRGDTEDHDSDIARADGFDDFMDMAEWFGDMYGLPFEGELIKWDEPQ